MKKLVHHPTEGWHQFAEYGRNRPISELEAKVLLKNKAAEIVRFDYYEHIVVGEGNRHLNKNKCFCATCKQGHAAPFYDAKMNIIVYRDGVDLECYKGQNICDECLNPLL